MTRLHGLRVIAAVGLTACSSGGSGVTASETSAFRPSPSEPTYFVEEPIDLLPDVPIALAINLEQLRADPALYQRMSKRLYDGIAPDESDLSTFQGLVDQIQSVYIGLTDLEADEPSLVMIVRGGRDGKTLKEALLEIEDIELREDPNGFLWADMDEGDNFVLVDPYTVILYEPALRLDMVPILAKQPRSQFRSSVPYKALSQSAGFGTSAASLLGTIQQKTIEKLTDETPMVAGPLLAALRTIDSFGLQISLDQGVELRLSAHTASREEASKLVGMLDLLKQVTMSNPKTAHMQPLLQDLQIDNQDAVVRVQLVVPVEFIEQLLDENTATPQKAGIKT